MPVSKIMPLIPSGTSSGFWATTCNPYKMVYVPVPVSIVVIFLLRVIFGFCLFPNMRILYPEKPLGTNERLVEFEVGDLLLSNGLANLDGLRDDAHDPEGTSRNRWNPGPGQVRRSPVWIGRLNPLTQGPHNPFPKLVRFLQQNLAPYVLSVCAVGKRHASRSGRCSAPAYPAGGCSGCSCQGLHCEAGT